MLVFSKTAFGFFVRNKSVTSDVSNGFEAAQCGKFAPPAGIIVKLRAQAMHPFFVSVRCLSKIRIETIR